MVRLPATHFWMDPGVREVAEERDLRLPWSFSAGRCSLTGHGALFSSGARAGAP